MFKRVILVSCLWMSATMAFGQTVPQGIVLTLPAAEVAAVPPVAAVNPVAPRADEVPVEASQHTAPTNQMLQRPRGDAGVILTAAEKRDLGFNYRNTRRIIRELRRDGFINDGTYQSEIDCMVFGIVKAEADPGVVAKITERLKAEGYEINDDPSAVGGFWDEINWDELFAFIERLIQLIMSLFADTSQHTGQLVMAA